MVVCSTLPWLPDTDTLMLVTTALYQPHPSSFSFELHQLIFSRTSGISHVIGPGENATNVSNVIPHTHSRCLPRHQHQLLHSAAQPSLPRPAFWTLTHRILASVNETEPLHCPFRQCFPYPDRLRRQSLWASLAELLEKMIPKTRQAFQHSSWCSRCKETGKSSHGFGTLQASVIEACRYRGVRQLSFIPHHDQTDVMRYIPGAYFGRNTSLVEHSICTVSATGSACS